MKLGVIDVGGGMRGIYASGVLDTCIADQVSFEYCIGISAGSANIVSYLAGQSGRNYRFYHDYSFRKEYMGAKNWAQSGSLINFEYIYGELSNRGGEDPLDYEAIVRNPAEVRILASDAETGEPKIFTKADLHQDDYRILMASSCVPGVDQPVEIDGRRYYDGALADPVPIRQAFDEGCDRVVLILTKPADVTRTPGKDRVFARMIRGKYPKAAENLLLRAERYNAGVALAREYAQQGKVLIVAPDDTCGVDTLKRKKSAMHALYQKGIQDGKAISAWLQPH